MWTGCSVGTESCGAVASDRILHLWTHLSPPLRLQRGIWELLLISWRCGRWCVTSCRRSNSCLLQHCWSSGISAWCPAWDCVLTRPSSPLSAPESRRWCNRRQMFNIWKHASKCHSLKSNCHHYLSIAETVDECNEKALKHRTVILKYITTIETCCNIVISNHINSKSDWFVSPLFFFHILEQHLCNN